MLVIANKQRTSFTNVENILNTLWMGRTQSILKKFDIHMLHSF